ncbi:uncharacterized protein METZ01_LOCUS234257 [marine metagenome]|uniref:Uncharacterized protein n=1 Tax=marine metagenome TaxID=408172 RepID=A0A382H3R2_9ZZZZ
MSVELGRFELGTFDPRIVAPRSGDLHKHPEAASGLPV